MKKIIILSTLLFTNLLFAQQFFVSLSDINKTNSKSFVIDSSFNLNGFHKDTGTEFDPSGFNQAGYGQ